MKFSDDCPERRTITENEPLREKCPNTVFSGPYFPAFSPNTGKYGPEKTLYLDTSHAVNVTGYLWNILIIRMYINISLFSTIAIEQRPVRSEEKQLFWCFRSSNWLFHGNFLNSNSEKRQRKNDLIAAQQTLFRRFFLKACVRYFLLFHQIFLPFENYEKCFLFCLKSSFRSRNIQTFVFPSSPLFLPVSHCFRGWLKLNPKVYDVINYLNKNLITHFVWYLEKEKGMALKLRS